MPEDIIYWIEQNFRISADVQTNLLASVAVILVLLILRQIINILVHRRTDDAAVIYRWRKATEYLALILGFIALIIIWLPDAGTFATYLGLLSAGLAIALQDPITNFVGWIFILWRHPFSVGDRIQIGDHAGDVVDVRYFQFSLLEIGSWVDADQSTGRVLHVPNKTVFTTTLANYSKGFSYIWNELAVIVSFESDWAKAKELLLEIANNHAAQKSVEAKDRVTEAARRYLISYENLTPIVYTKVVDFGVRLTIRYLTEPRQRRSTENALWEEILDTFAAEPTIEFAYPTVRRYIHPEESKPALRPEAIYGHADDGSGGE
jgi:small-conductance mechanosensitive channel